MNAAIKAAIANYERHGGYSAQPSETIAFSGQVATNSLIIFNMPSGEFFARVNGRPADKSRVLGLFERHEMFRAFPA